jgi:hypothetical protein
MSLDTPGMDSGQYTLDVVTRGPGIRKELKESRSILIQQPISNDETDAAGDVRKQRTDVMRPNQAKHI